MAGAKVTLFLVNGDGPSHSQMLRPLRVVGRQRESGRCAHEARRLVGSPYPPASRLRFLCLVAAVAGAFAIGPGARAEDGGGTRTVPTYLRVHDVSDLVLATADVLPDDGPAPIAPREPKRDPVEFFARDAERRTLRGELTGFADVVRGSVYPGAWDRKPCFLVVNGVGCRTLLACRNTWGTVGEVGRFLEQKRRRDLETVVVDVVALAGDSAAMADGDVAAAVAKGALVPLAAARASGLTGQQFVGRQGGEAAYLRGYAPDETGQVKRAAPLVGAVVDGLSFAVRATRTSEDRLHLDASAWWARPLPARAHEPPDVAAVEPPAVDGRTVRASLDVTPGVWVALASTSTRADGVVFALRATVRPYDLVRKPEAVFSQPRPEWKEGEPYEIWHRRLQQLLGPLVLRSYDVGDLTEKVESRRATPVDLSISGSESPRPEVPAGKPRFAVRDLLVDLIREEVEWWTWVEDGVEIELKDTTLVVRNGEAQQRSLEAFLADLRGTCARAARLDMTIVSMPAASLPEYWGGLDDAKLAADGGKALAGRRGARVVDRLTLRVASGQRDVRVSGTQRSVTGEYEVKVANGAAVGTPVPRRVFEGVSFDVEAADSGNGAGVVLQIRMDRTTPRPGRTAETPYGALNLPSIGLTRMYGGVATAYGATRIVSASLEGNEVTLVLIAAASE